MYLVREKPLIFSEIKGMQGCHVMKKKGSKKMPIPRQEIIDNPTPTSLFICYSAVLLFVGTGCNLRNNMYTFLMFKDNFY